MKMYLKRAASVVALSLPAAILNLAHAQGVGQRSERLELETVEVTGQEFSLTAVGASAAREKLQTIPGAVGLVEADVFLDEFTQSIGDALVLTPGVYADTSAQRESRLSIRGSGLNATFERRGITVRRDGVPISRASGITEFQEVDPLTVDYIEVYKGANGLRYGAASLGGAINIVTPTALTRDERATLRLEGGSFNTYRASASYSEVIGDWDFYTGVTALQSDGFRDHSAIDSIYGHANLGYGFNSGAETRFYLTALSDNFELSGSLPLSIALSDPESAGLPVTIGPFFPGGPVTVLDPGPEADDWDRNLDVYRLANRTVIPFDGFTLETGIWVANRKLDHAITRFAGIIAQSEDEIGASVRMTGETALFGFAADWIIGAEYAVSENEALRYANNSGRRGALTSDSDQTAYNFTSYAQAELEVREDVTLVLGAQYVEANRESEAVLNAVDGELTRSNLSPRFGVLWDVSDTAQLFFNINQSYEPAGVSDLTAGGVLPFTPLEAQSAWTVEFGTRGEAGRFAWDAAIYRSTIEDEFVSLAYPGTNGATSATFNADDTVHQGLELGVDTDLTTQRLSDAGMQLTWRNTFTLNDFYFDSNATGLNGAILNVDGNTLAGVPEQILISDLRLQGDRFYVTANLRHVPDGPFVDYANTVQAPGYTIYGLTGGLDLTDDLQLFASVENLTDEVYISNIAATGNQSQENTRAFTPGQGRAAYIGVSARF